MDFPAVLRQTIADATPLSKSIFGGDHAMSWEEVTEFINQYPVAMVSSVDASGAPHVTGKAAVFMDGKVYIGSRPETAMGRNLRRNPNVALAFAEPPWKRQVFIYGEVRFLEKHGQEERRVQDTHRSVHGYETVGIAEVVPRKVFTCKGST